MVGKRSGCMDLSTKKTWIPGTPGMTGDQRVVHQLKTKGTKSAVMRGRGADDSRGDRSTDSRYDEGRSIDCRDFDSRPDMNKMDRAVSVLERKSRELSTPIKRSFTAPSRSRDKDVVSDAEEHESDAISIKNSEMRRNVEAHLRDDIEEVVITDDNKNDDTCDAESEMEVGFESVITVSEASYTDPMTPLKESEKSIAISESEKTDTTFKSEDSRIEEKRRVKPMTQMERDVSEFERKSGPLTTPVGRTLSISTPVKRSDKVTRVKRASVSLSVGEEGGDNENEGDSDGEINSIEGVALLDEENSQLRNMDVSSVAVGVEVEVEVELHIIEVPTTLSSKESDDNSEGGDMRRKEEEDNSDISNDRNDNLVASQSTGRESMQDERCTTIDENLLISKESVQARTVECTNMERDLGSDSVRILEPTYSFSMELFCAEYVHCLVMSVVSRVAHAGSVLRCMKPSYFLRGAINTSHSHFITPIINQIRVRHTSLLSCPPSFTHSLPNSPHPSLPPFSLSSQLLQSTISTPVKARQGPAIDRLSRP